MTTPAYDPEYTVVPEDEQLDHDDDGSDDTNALTPETGDDTEDLDKYRDRDGKVWPGE